MGGVAAGRMVPVMACLACALVAGFVVGSATRDDLASARAAQPLAKAVNVAASSPAQSVVAEQPAAVAFGEGTADDQWPADEKGDGCAAPIWPEADPGAPRVLLVGDSLFRNAREDLEGGLAAHGWAATVRCWGATGTDWGVGQVERARELGQLPDTVVVSFGTNDIWWLGIPMETAVDQMMASLGPDRTVYWVNLWYDQSAYDDLPDPARANEVLAEKAQEYANLYVIDFARAFQGAAASGGDVGWTDGVHLNPSANALRTALIVAAVTS